MKRGSEWLARGAELLAEKESAGEPPAFDVLVIGSGYGGAVAAARIADWKPPGGQARLSVAVLERGLEYLPGDFPRTTDELAAHVRISGLQRGGIGGWRDGLFDVRVGDDVHALVANGLGGGSLINAGVAERADDAALADPVWPAPWFGNKARWNELYDRAAAALGAAPWNPGGTPKEDALKRLAERLGAEARPVALTIHPHAGAAAPAPGAGAAGAPPQPCVQCGDCFSGCNVGAKRTLGTTYLQRARELGAELYTGATVLKLQRNRRPDRDRWPWRVRWVFTDPSKLPGQRKPFTVRARQVVLAAGTFGSPEILMRSDAPGLRFSSELGAGFSTNGDVIGAQFGLPYRATSWARDTEPRDRRCVGPTITHQVKLGDGSRRRRVVVQDLAVPAPLGWLYGELLTSLMVPQRWTRFDLARRTPDSPDPAVVDDEPGGALEHTLLVAGYGDDGAAGRLCPLPGFDQARHDGHLVVQWPGAGELPCFTTLDGTLRAATRGTGAYWLRNPLWQAVPDSPLIDAPRQRSVLTVHPLGGCRMALSMANGVVDPFGRVFDAGSDEASGPRGSRGATWATREDRRLHEGLHVLDGSIVPASLGINPLLTITALAEGIVDEWLRDWRVTMAPDASASARWPAPGPWPVRFPTPEAWTVGASATTGLRFGERMVGVLDDPQMPPPGGADSRWRLSMKFDFHEIGNLADFVRLKRKSVNFTAQVQIVRSGWDADRGRQSDGPGLPIQLEGSAAWFEHAPACVLPRAWRAFQGWRRLRKAADLWHTGHDGEPQPPVNQRPGGWAGMLCKAWHFAKVLTHFGAPRLLKYTFKPLKQPLCSFDAQGQRVQLLPAGTEFSGEKALVYARDGNPWLQLTEMPLLASEGGQRRALTSLRYDEMFMIGRDDLPLKMTRQHDGVTGIRDLASLLLYAGRVVFAQHFLSFRKPDYAPYRTLHRLPFHDPAKTRFPQLEFTVFPVPVDSKAASAKIRLQLTRVRRRGEAPGKPVLLLHGFGSGGIQFTHEAIEPPLAQWLAEKEREVWVGELRTSIGLPTCEQQWVMDDIALEDVPALVAAVRRLRGDGKTADKIDVVSHCIGSAMFWMAALAGRLTGAIEHAVTMQVGPIVHLPRGNRARGYFGNRAQKFLGLGFIDATVDDRATDADVALDRVLATFPFLGDYVRGAWLLRRPDTHDGLRLSGDLRHNARLVNAMRSAGVFSQLFQWRNMAREGSVADQPLLDALPDLLGTCNLTTYQQTVQYAFLRRLTNQDGEGVYVTDDNVRRYIDFNVMFVQGELNDVFAPRGTEESAKLLRRLVASDRAVERVVAKGYGHLDCVVGLDAETMVFEPLLPFLQGGGSKKQPPKTLPMDVRAPTIGPWLGHSQRIDDTLVLHIGLKVDEQRTSPSHIYSVLVDATTAQPQANSLIAHETGVAGTPVNGAPLRPCWFFHGEGEAVLRVDIPAALFDGRDLHVWIGTIDAPAPGPMASPQAFVAAWKGLRADRPRRAPRSDVELPIDDLQLDGAWLARRACPPADISFAVLACRQAPLVSDRQLADAGFGTLARRLRPLEHVLMVGDQIYADAMAAGGGAEHTRLRFFDAYREAWTAHQQRDVMRRRPVYMAADDHEFRNDHDHDLRQRHDAEWRAAREAMHRYQYAPGPLKFDAPVPGGGRFWYAFESAGCLTFVCDTRNKRQLGRTVDCEQARIMSEPQWDAITTWLAKSQATRRPRFLVLPTPVAPVFADAVSVPAYRVRCEDWQRFPKSLERLFGLLLADGAANLTLIGGDYHCFADCLVTLDDPREPARRVQFRSVTVPGVYQPYSFANTTCDELWQPSPACTALNCGPYRWQYRLDAFDARSGFVEVSTRGPAATDVTFVPADNSPVPPGPPLAASPARPGAPARGGVTLYAAVAPSLR